MKKSILVVLAGLVVLTTSWATEPQKQYPSKLFPEITFINQDLVSGFDFGYGLAVRDIVEACEKLGHFGPPKKTFTCRPYPTAEL